jgi:magnesium-protoporphyrin O-methyltransferase
MADYSATRDRVEDYFDRSATKVWARLTSDAPVSRIRETVRAGRDWMRATMMARLPDDLAGCRVLDAGCGTGLMTAELAARGADVVAVDISPQLIGIAKARLSADHLPRVTFTSGDMLSADHGRFDYVMAMDSLIYYTTPDIAAALDRLGQRTRQAIVFTVAPRTPFLMAFFTIGKAFPRADRSPVMIPHAFTTLNAATKGRLTQINRVTSGFYISECLEFRP